MGGAEHVIQDLSVLLFSDLKVDGTCESPLELVYRQSANLLVEFLLEVTLGQVLAENTIGNQLHLVRQESSNWNSLETSEQRIKLHVAYAPVVELVLKHVHLS